MSGRILMLSLVATTMSIPVFAQNNYLTVNMGGGVTTPLNPTAQYAGTSGHFVGAAGYRINKTSSIIGEFMVSGLPPNIFVVQPINAPFGAIHLYTMTANYRFEASSINRSRFGVYGTIGGGWYYRYAKIDKNFILPPGTVCDPIYTWWGYGCSAGTVFTATVANKGVSSGGLNGGVGFTIRFGDSPWKFYTESRYHYAFSAGIPSTLVPVTLGVRFN